ncbi:LysR family transcriptional regulator [Paenibacillus sp. NPDC058071]|uniref:LysR family transcriptional regulator n=1 Tax=Paenibacillus sp. NPDC058071 TaxID=3346326 RepID=UPI0036DD0BD6
MDIRMIKTFQTIVKLGSFQQAAEALQYSQPAITLHIQKLEADLGTKLLERGKKLKLTEAGKVFYARADLLLKEYEDLAHTMTVLEQGDAGIVRIGVGEPTASRRLPALLAEFTEQFPQVKLQVRVGDSKQLHELLAAEQLDFAVCPTPELSIDMEFKPLFSEPMGLLLYDSHPLAANRYITLKQLAGENLIFTPPVCPVRVQIEQIIVNHIDHNYNKIEVSNARAHPYYVQAKLGIAIASIASITPPIAGTVVRQLADLGITPIVGLLRKRDAPIGAASEKLMQLIEEAWQEELSIKQLFPKTIASARRKRAAANL